MLLLTTRIQWTYTHACIYIHIYRYILIYIYIYIYMHIDAAHVLNLYGINVLHPHIASRYTGLFAGVFQNLPTPSNGCLAGRARAEQRPATTEQQQASGLAELDRNQHNFVFCFRIPLCSIADIDGALRDIKILYAYTTRSYIY